MKLESLQALLLHQVQDMYDAEKQLLKAMPKLAQAVASPDLRAALEKHLEETEGQVARLEQVFELLGAPAKGKKCKAMAGIIAEAEETLEEDAEPEVRDAAVIAAAQKVEHYEICGYGTVLSYAKRMQNKEVAHLFQATLAEEKKADKLLTELAESAINLEAA